MEIKKSFASHRFWSLIYLMPWLVGIFPIHFGIKPGFPDFPTSSFQPLLPKPTQPLPVVSSSACGFQLSGLVEGGGKERRRGKEKEGGGMSRRRGRGKEKRKGEGGWQCWAPSRGSWAWVLPAGPPMLAESRVRSSPLKT